MGEKGNSSDMTDTQRVASTTQPNVVIDTVSAGANTLADIATGAVTGAATGVVKDKVDERLKNDDDDEPTH